MTEAQLSIFIQVAERRSFTAAALNLGITQSAVSHAIKSLEKSLQVALFQRTKSAVELSQIGEQLLLRAREVVSLYEAMRQDAAAARGLKMGTLRIGSFGPTASMQLLPVLMSAFTQAYPGIVVHIDEGPDQAVLQWLQERRIDIGFVTLPQESYETLELISDQMVAVVHPQHALAQYEAIALEQLCEDPFILTEAGSASIVQGLFAKRGLVPNIRYRSAQVISTLAYVSRNEGVTIMAERALPPSVTQGEYCVRPLCPTQPRQVGLAFRTGALTPAAEAFITLSRKIRPQLQ